MSNDALMTKLEVSALAVLSFSSFGLRHSFVIRRSAFDIGAGSLPLLEHIFSLF
jgi:hypothetical protein